MKKYFAKRILEWFEKEGEEFLVDEVEINITIEQLEFLFGPKPQEPLFYGGYEIFKEHLPKLRICNIKGIDVDSLELEKYSYFISTVQADENSKSVKNNFIQYYLTGYLEWFERGDSKRRICRSKVDLTILQLESIFGVQPEDPFFYSKPYQISEEHLRQLADLDLAEVDVDKFDFNAYDYFIVLYREASRF